MKTQPVNAQTDTEFLVLVNPAAGGGQTGRRVDSLLRALDAAGIDFQHRLSDAPGGCHELAAEARQAGCGHFISVGGDGTANEVVNGIFAVNPQDVPATLAVVPWGTGNDWATYYGLPSQVDEFIKMLQSGNSVLQDIGRVRFGGPDGESKHYFLNCTGTGFDSYLLARMGSGKGSRLRYLQYVLRSLVSYHASRLTLELAQRQITTSALMLEVCLGRYIGAGMHLAPEADAGDGAFEVVLIEELSRWQLLASLPYLYNGRINEHPRVRHLRCDHLEITSADDQHFQCDGELIGQLPIKLDILRDALRVATRNAGPG